MVRDARAAGLPTGRTPAYLVAMALLPKPAPLGDAWSDMVGFVFQRRPHQYVFAALSVAIPILVYWGFVDQFSYEKEYIPPTPIYVQQWSTERTRADMQAQQAKDLPGELARKKAQADAIEKRKAMFRKLQAQLKAVGG
jgi:hypothetical protein